mgnify:CR=1 FL=1
MNPTGHTEGPLQEPPPSQEPSRLRALSRLELLDSPPDPELDRLTAHHDALRAGFGALCRQAVEDTRRMHRGQVDDLVADAVERVRRQHESTEDGLLRLHRLRRHAQLGDFTVGYRREAIVKGRKNSRHGILGANPAC